MTAAPLAGALVDATALRDSTLFAGFDDSQCRRIGEACRELDVDAGTTPTEQGENGYALFASSRERPTSPATESTFVRS